MLKYVVSCVVTLLTVVVAQAAPDDCYSKVIKEAKKQLNSYYSTDKLAAETTVYALTGGNSQVNGKSDNPAFKENGFYNTYNLSTKTLYRNPKNLRFDSIGSDQVVQVRFDNSTCEVQKVIALDTGGEDNPKVGSVYVKNGKGLQIYSTAEAKQAISLNLENVCPPAQQAQNGKSSTAEAVK